MGKTAEVKCPTCGRKGPWFEASYGPFCSHRCKLVDLGKWFGEEHVISEPLDRDEDEADGTNKRGPRDVEEET
jgi:endogenous inhibitor of DNA gyrase (YacG/DUF329 family)